jgi:hypothetical protein
MRKLFITFFSFKVSAYDTAEIDYTFNSIKLDFRGVLKISYTKNISTIPDGSTINVNVKFDKNVWNSYSNGVKNVIVSEIGGRLSPIMSSKTNIQDVEIFFKDSNNYDIAHYDKNKQVTIER